MRGSAARRHHQWFTMAQLERRISVIDRSIDGDTKLAAVRQQSELADGRARVSTLEAEHSALRADAADALATARDNHRTQLDAAFDIASNQANRHGALAALRLWQQKARHARQHGEASTEAERLRAELAAVTLELEETAAKHAISQLAFDGVLEKHTGEVAAVNAALRAELASLRAELDGTSSALSAEQEAAAVQAAALAVAQREASAAAAAADESGCMCEKVTTGLHRIWRRRRCPPPSPTRCAVQRICSPPLSAPVSGA